MIHVNGKDYLFAKCTGYVAAFSFIRRLGLACVESGAVCQTGRDGIGRQPRSTNMSPIAEVAASLRSCIAHIISFPANLNGDGLWTQRLPSCFLHPLYFFLSANPSSPVLILRIAFIPYIHHT